MMIHAQGFPRSHCNLLAVFCGKNSDYKFEQAVPDDHKPKYPLPELTSSKRLEVQVLNNPSTDELRQAIESSVPDIVYLRGKQKADTEEVGSLILGETDLSTPNVLTGFFGSTVPSIVYLETPNSEELAEALYSKGVSYVIYWKHAFSWYAACHFRQALLSVISSSCSHTWDAFQLAHASFRLYCVRNNAVLPSHASPNADDELGPCLLGDPPKLDIVSPVADDQGEENPAQNLPSIKIYDDDVTIRFLVCGPPCALDSSLLKPLEDGLNALLRIEMRGSKLHNRTSAPPPPLQAGTFARGVVTMRCDISTCSSAHALSVWECTNLFQ